MRQSATAPTSGDPHRIGSGSANLTKNVLVRSKLEYGSFEYRATKVWFGWFLCLMAYQLFSGYLIPKPFSQKNSSGTI